MSAIDRLAGVSTFVRVVEDGSFARAAARLGLTRSAVAKQMAQLEQRLGVRLLHRTTRRLSLTEAGQSYHEHCQRALAELQAAEAGLDEGRREPVGRLRVTAPVLFGRHVVAPLMAGLMQRHPKLEVEIGFTDRPVDLAHEGYDLGVRVGELADTAELVARRLGSQRMVVCAAPAYLARHGRPRRLEDLEHHAGVLYAGAGAEKGWRLRTDDGGPPPRPTARLRLDDVQAIADAAVAGLGVAWLPCWLVARHIAAGTLELVLEDRHLLAAPIHAVWPRGRHLPLKTRLAIDALAAEVARVVGEGESCADAAAGPSAPRPDGAIAPALSSRQ